jgi:hypothetical protein
MKPTTLAYCVEDYNHFESHRFFASDKLEDAEVYMIRLVHSYQRKLHHSPKLADDWKTIRMLVVCNNTTIEQWEVKWTAEALLEAKY